MKLNFFLFDGFESLDLFGPVDLLCRMEGAVPGYYSARGGVITGAQNTGIITKPWSEADSSGVFIIPGGMGTRPLVKDEEALALIKKAAEDCEYCLSVCTGSAVLAAAGVLDGRIATSNKKAFDWASSFGNGVKWQREPRFCKDGKFYTAAGVSAGIDLAIEFIKDMKGEAAAEKAAKDAEYLSHVRN